MVGVELIHMLLQIECLVGAYYAARVVKFKEYRRAEGKVQMKKVVKLAGERHFIGAQAFKNRIAEQELRFAEHCPDKAGQPFLVQGKLSGCLEEEA